MRLRVLDADESVLWDDELRAGRFQIGTVPQADLILPRARYLGLARIELELDHRDGELFYKHLGSPRLCSVDGRVGRTGSLSPGLHFVELGDARFTIVVDP